MTLCHRDAGGAVRTAGAVYLRSANGTDPDDLAAIDEMHIRTADGTASGDLKAFYKRGLRLAADPEFVSGFTTAKTGAVFTNSVTVGVAGGTPPYAHSWVATTEISVSSSASATTSFSGVPPGENGEIEGTATDTVTDSSGFLTASITIQVSLIRGQI